MTHVGFKAGILSREKRLNFKCNHILQPKRTSLRSPALVNFSRARRKFASVATGGTDMSVLDLGIFCSCLSNIVLDAPSFRFVHLMQI